MRDKLQECRKRKGITQAEIASRVGISTRSYRFIETGERAPSVDTAVKIAKVLKSTVEKLFPLETDASLEAATSQDAGDKR